jgi:hypothetical protein
MVCIRVYHGGGRRIAGELAGGESLSCRRTGETRSRAA